MIGSTPSDRGAPVPEEVTQEREEGAPLGPDGIGANPPARVSGTGVDRQALEEERDFLLRSLRDLDAEREAGDLDEEDYQTLRDDYTGRTARVLRALDAPAGTGSGGPVTGAAPPPDRKPAPVGRWSPVRLAVVAGLVAAVIAGAVVAVLASSGQRGANQAISGLTPPGADPRLDQARSRIAKKDVLGAIKLYDAVLAGDPQQPEALTYRGWLLRLTSLQDPNLADLGNQGLRSIEAAENADPNYPDAHVFRGIILLQDRHDPGGAITEFRTFLSLDPADPLVPTVEEALREALAEAGPNAPSATSPPPATSAGTGATQPPVPATSVP
jgi:hypothetical protein